MEFGCDGSWQGGTRQIGKAVRMEWWMVTTARLSKPEG